jgi:hypothetical protein
VVKVIVLVDVETEKTQVLITSFADFELANDSPLCTQIAIITTYNNYQRQTK